MKKFFTLIAVAAMAFAAQANVLTVCDGGEYGYEASTIPIYGLYADEVGTIGQMIYPAELLSEMAGSQITGVKFYTTAYYFENYADIDDAAYYDYINFSNATIQLSLKTVDEAGFVTVAEIVGATPVATTVPVEGDDFMMFNLDEPFNYQGGNLLVECKVIEAGSYGSTYFFGDVIGYNSCYYAYNSSNGTYDFLPMASFTYEAGSIPVDPTIDPVAVGAPVFQGYTIDGITGYGVGINPTTEGSEIMYRVLIWDPVTEEWVLRTDWTLYEGTEGEIWFENNGEKVRIEAYAFIGESRSQDVAYEFTVATALDELMSGKTVAGVRYFNMAGQEMQQAEGLTIVVTTYTDGTTNAVKVVK